MRQPDVPLTTLDSGVALAKLFRYRSAKVSDTGSFRSMTVESSCVQEHKHAQLMTLKQTTATVSLSTLASIQ